MRRAFVSVTAAFALFAVMLVPGVALGGPSVEAELPPAAAAGCDNDAVAKSHRQVFDDMRQRGIGVNLHYIPVHLQPYYRELGFSEGQFPEAEAHGREAITLPLYPEMSDSMQDQIVSSLRQTLGH